MKSNITGAIGLANDVLRFGTYNVPKWLGRLGDFIMIKGVLEGCA